MAKERTTLDLVRAPNTLSLIQNSAAESVRHDLSSLLCESSSDEYIGLVYALQTTDGRLVVGRAGSLSDPLRAQGALFQAAFAANPMELE